VKLLMSYFRRFLRHRTRLLLGVLAIPLAQSLDVATTILVGQALDRVRQSSEIDWLSTTLWLLAAAAVGHAFFRFWQRWLIVVVSRRFEVELKQELFDHLVRLDFAFHDRSRSGDLVSRLTADVEALRMFLGPGLMYTLGAVVIVPISLGWLMTLNLWLGLAIGLPMIAVGLIMKQLSPRLHRESTAVQESLADISHRAQEDFGGVRVVKGYHREAAQARRFESSSAQNRDNQIQLGRARGLTHAAINGSFDLTFAVILLVGGLAAIDRTLPVGDLFQFVDLTLKVFWPLIALGWIAGMYPRAVASAERVDALLATRSALEAPAAGSETAAPAEGGLALEGVGFTYPKGTAPALKGIDATVPPGGSLGVVGPTGCGKSTLLLLLGRQMDPQEGTVRLDGADLRSLPLAQARRALGYVPQDAFLFSVPYADNIRFGADGELSDAEVAELIEQAAMTEEVARFPEGDRTLIGERGVTLSGGQRQRTCIARALARDPRVLVLDDCLSAVDTETESRLLGTLREAGSGRTVVVAAHRLSTVASCDEILVLSEDGAIAQRGTHEELVAREGWYRDTWEQQQRRESRESEQAAGPGGVA
jgi:ATP-binding cassette subfamily B multidrug efflux pump